MKKIILISILILIMLGCSSKSNNIDPLHKKNNTIYREHINSDGSNSGVKIKYDIINNFGFRSIKYQYTKCTKDHKKGFVKMTEYDNNNKIKAIISGKLETISNRNNIPLKFKVLMVCSLLKHKIIKSTYYKNNPISLDDLITIDSLVYIKGKDGYPINIHPFTGTVKNHHFKDGIEM